MPEAVRAVAAAGTAGERQAVEAFVDYMRWAVVRKVADLSEDQAGQRLVSSDTTLAGMLRHLTFVERNWFQRTVAGRPVAELELYPDAPEKTWAVPAAGTVASLIEDYERECALSRETAARFDFSDTFENEQLGRVSLRWIMLHMIEETARHAGHADILREQTDGQTGDFG